jgi:hypothetical protein
MPMSLRLLCVMAAAMAVGCASSGTSGNAGGPQKGTLLTADEIATFDAEGKSAYDVVARLRPRWLLARGVRPLRGESDSTEFALVVINGLPMGRIQRLRDIEAFQVADIRYSDPSESGAKFGERGSSGVIEVRTKISSRRQ